MNKQLSDPTATRRAFLKSCTVFRHLSDAELDALPLADEAAVYKRGSIIYEEGSRIGGFYVVYRGVVKIYKTGADGKDQIIRFAKPGNLMGFRSTITGEVACTSTRAIEDAKILYIPAETVTQLVKTNGSFAMDLLQIACSELREANDYITDIAQKTVRERLAEVLIHLMRSFELDAEQYLKINLTREELANIVGTTTESVIRLLSEFKKNKLIELSGRRIQLLRVKELMVLSNMDY